MIPDLAIRTEEKVVLGKYGRARLKYIKENKSIRDGLFLYNVNTIDNDTGIFSIR